LQRGRHRKLSVLVRKNSTHQRRSQEGSQREEEHVKRKDRKEGVTGRPSREEGGNREADKRPQHKDGDMGGGSTDKRTKKGSCY
jgi:hypothetical protein